MNYMNYNENKPQTLPSAEYATKIGEYFKTYPSTFPFSLSLCYTQTHTLWFWHEIVKEIMKG